MKYKHSSAWNMEHGLVVLVVEEKAEDNITVVICKCGKHIVLYCPSDLVGLRFTTNMKQLSRVIKFIPSIVGPRRKI